MAKQAKRGFLPSDERDFSVSSVQTIRTAAEDVYFLLNRGYAVKNATTFVGNHYLLSERQRLALARVISPEKQIQLRKQKALSEKAVAGKVLHIDGFNTIITLEIAFSSSMLFRCMDGTIRDLAGLRGTYRLIPETSQAIQAIMETLTVLSVQGAVFYLDAPVSNSGRLRQRILEMLETAPFSTEVRVEDAVDTLLKAQTEPVVTADAIILDECGSWFNLTDAVIQRTFQNYPYLQIY